MPLQNNDSAFFESENVTQNAMNSSEQILNWIRQRNNAVKVCIEKISFSELSDWVFDKTSNNLIHSSRNFFSVDGIRVKTNWGDVAEWNQPIINQPEIGYLGIIIKDINGIVHFLLQAKIEPGNVNHVQLSPTLQATKSNYTQIHKGNKPLYLDYFQNVKPEQIIVDQLQSEQGARFLKKRNRNIIIKVDHDIKLNDNFVWVTLQQIKELMRIDNVINMDTRSVISTLPLEFIAKDVKARMQIRGRVNKSDFHLSATDNDKSINSINQIISFLTNQKCKYELKIKKIPLQSMDKWIISSKEIYKKDGIFKVIAVDVEIDNREVKRWSQPMIAPTKVELSAFIAKKINGVLHFAVQTILECGNLDKIEFAPTVQCLLDENQKAVPLLNLALNADKEQIYYDAMQSEEGGRFYQEQNRNMIVIVDDELSNELPENHIWMTLNQIFYFLRHNNYFNIQARSLIAAISYD